MNETDKHSIICSSLNPKAQQAIPFATSRKTSRSRKVSVSSLEAKIEGLGLGENLGKSRSLLEQTFKRLGLQRKGLVYIPEISVRRPNEKA